MMRGPVISLAALAFVTALAAERIPRGFGLGNEIQQVLEGKRKTLTSTITKTEYRLEVVTPSPVSETATPQTSITTSSLAAVQTWYSGQKEEGCDKTACASCRWWYKCQDSGVECLPCDDAAYCAECPQDNLVDGASSAASQAATAFEVCSRKLESNAPCIDSSLKATFNFHANRVVVSEGTREKVALSAIANFHNEAEFADAVREAVPRKYCFVGPKKQIPCYELGGYLVFGD